MRLIAERKGRDATRSEFDPAEVEALFAMRCNDPRVGLAPPLKGTAYICRLSPGRPEGHALRTVLSLPSPYFLSSPIIRSYFARTMSHR